MQFAVHQFLLSLREAAAIWLALIATAVFAIAGMLAPDRVRHGRDLRRERRAAKAAEKAAAKAAGAGRPARKKAVGRQSRVGRLAAEAAELVRFADEVAVAATRAGVTAQRRHAEWLAALSEQDTAWRAYEVADANLRRLRKAAAFGLPDSPRTPREYADRERYLHRAATEAYRRGELSLEQWNDALAHRGYWDPARHPFEQEMVVRRVGQQRMLRIYRAAAIQERAAWRQNEMAAIARRSLDEEAFAAAIEADRARNRLAAATAPRRLRIGLAHRATLATR
jgi:hypothetical protein